MGVGQVPLPTPGPEQNQFGETLAVCGLAGPHWWGREGRVTAQRWLPEPDCVARLP